MPPLVQLGGDFFAREQSLPFVGLQEYAAPFSNIANLQLGLRIYVTPKLMLSVRGNIAHGVNEINTFFKDINNQNYLGGGLSLEYDSFMGSFVFTIGKNNWNEELQVAVNLGYRFVF